MYIIMNELIIGSTIHNYKADGMHEVVNKLKFKKIYLDFLVEARRISTRCPISHYVNLAN